MSNDCVFGDSAGFQRLSTGASLPAEVMGLRSALFAGRWLRESRDPQEG